MRPKVIDCFPFNNELDILECRLVELGEAVDSFVLVEATRDHQDHVKPLHFAENVERFKPWAKRIVHVVVKDGEMPSKAQDNDPWAREHAQREFIARGLAKLDLCDSDVILQSDVDEIPRALHARNVRPQGFWSFAQRGHFFAIDWLYPHPWYGTVAATVGHLNKFPADRRFSYMRDVRMTALNPSHLTDAGWHLSWLGGAEAAVAKVGSYCHPEVTDRILDGLATDRFLRHGIHVDGVKMRPVDVDESWPKWIVAGNAPANWYRLRDE